MACAGCSGDGADDPPVDTDQNGATPVTCDSETRAEEFVPGMVKQTEDGVAVALVEADPAPPARLDNSWLFSLEDSNGEPLSGARLTLDPLMPDHGHGSPREPVVTELGDGEYRAEPVALFMPGYWLVEVSVTVEDAPAGSVEFGFCVP